MRVPFARKTRLQSSATFVSASVHVFDAQFAPQSLSLSLSLNSYSRNSALRAFVSGELFCRADRKLKTRCCRCRCRCRYCHCRCGLLTCSSQLSFGAAAERRECAMHFSSESASDINVSLVQQQVSSRVAFCLAIRLFPIAQLRSPRVSLCLWKTARRTATARIALCALWRRELLPVLRSAPHVLCSRPVCSPLLH